MWALLNPVIESLFHTSAPEDRITLTYANYSEYLVKVNHYLGTGGKQVKNRERMLYDGLRSRFTQHCKRILAEGRNCDGDDLLRYYTREFDKYLKISASLNSLCAYLNRFWVKKQQEHPGTRSSEENEAGEVFEIKVMCLVAWRDTVFAENFPLYDRAFEMITRDRNGEKFSASLVRGLTQCFVDLGSSELLVADQLQIYRDHFETSFIEDTKVYYRNEALEFLSQNSVPDYLTHVDSRLREEEARCQETSGSVHSSSMALLLNAVQEVLLVEHAAQIVSEIPPLLIQGQLAPLAAGYKLFKLIDPAMGMEPFKDTFQEYVTTAGKDEIAKTLHAKEDSDGTKKGSSVNPKTFVEAILKVHADNTTVIKQAFNGDSTFTARLDKAVRSFVNGNAVTAEAGAGKSARDAASRASQESSRLLAKFCDQVLTDKKMDTEIAKDTLVGGAMRLFPYLECGDVFSKYYQKDLAKRLLTGKSNDDAERAVISSLKGQCGVEWSRKLQKMFEDEQVSVNLDKEYGKLPSRPREVAVSGAMIITRNQWPMVKASQGIKLPNAITAALVHFKTFYSHKHQSRKLTWQVDKSRGELSTPGLRGNHRLQCSMHQMAILMMFNTKKGTMSIRDIIDNLDGGEGAAAYVHAVLETLIKYKLLDSGSRKKVAELDESTELKLNKKWKVKQTKLDINDSLKVKGVSADQLESDETADEIARERENIIDCTVVKQMKSLAGKSITHVQLMSNVAEMLKSGNGTARFQPDARMLKNRILHLTQNDYMDRAPGDAKSYIYKP